MGISASTAGRSRWLCGALILLSLPGSWTLLLPEVFGASAWGKGAPKPPPVGGLRLSSLDSLLSLFY